MAGQGRTTAPKSDDLRSIPGAHMVGGIHSLSNPSFGLHIDIVVFPTPVK